MLKQDVAEVGWNWRQVAARLRSDGGSLPRRCYCWNIGLPIFSFAPPCLCIPVLTAPFICRMQIECNRCCAARHWPLAWGSGLRAKQRETTVTQAQLHVCIRSIAVLSPNEKKITRDLARDTAQARKFFIPTWIKRNSDISISLYHDGIIVLFVSPILTKN